MVLIVRVGRQVRVPEHQHLTVGQAQGYQWRTGLILADGRDGNASGERQGNALQLCAVIDVEKDHFALVGDAHADLVLLFDGDHHWRTGVRQPGGIQRRVGGQAGTFEKRRNHIGKVEKISVMAASTARPPMATYQ